MNLVNELQVSAQQDDVLTVLRKTQRLASKLARKDIIEWLKFEQDGFPRGHEVPDYRKVGTWLAYNSNGYLPAGYGYVKSGVEDVPGLDFSPDHWVRGSISEVVDHINRIDNNRSIYVPIVNNSEEDKFFRRCVNVHPEFAHQITFLLRLNPAQVKSIPEKIKNKVLNWACELEAAGVQGEGMSFSSEEKKMANSTTIQIYGSKIGQMTGEGNNYRLTSRDGDNAITGEGNVLLTRGSKNELSVNKPKEGVFHSIWDWVKGRFGIGEE